VLRIKILILIIIFLVICGIARLLANLTCRLVYLLQKISDAVKGYEMKLAEELDEFQDRGG